MKKNPEIIKYLEAENAYTDSFMNPHAGFADNLYKEMLGRIKQTDLSVPYKYGDFWYYSKTEEGKQYPIYLRAKTRDGNGEQVLLDQNEMAKDFKYFRFPISASATTEIFWHFRPTRPATGNTLCRSRIYGREKSCRTASSA